MNQKRTVQAPPRLPPLSLSPGCGSQPAGVFAAGIATGRRLRQVEGEDGCPESEGETMDTFF